MHVFKSPMRKAECLTLEKCEETDVKANFSVCKTSTQIRSTRICTYCMQTRNIQQFNLLGTPDYWVDVTCVLPAALIFTQRSNKQ